MADKDDRTNRAIMEQNINNNPTGRLLTSEAKERAIDFACESWKGQMGNGEASELGIRHVLAGVLKDNKE